MGGLARRFVAGMRLGQAVARNVIKWGAARAQFGDRPLAGRFERRPGTAHPLLITPPISSICAW